MKKNLKKDCNITDFYFNKIIIDYLLSPPLPTLFRDYTPRFIKGDLIWIKKNAPRQSINS